MDSLYLCDDFGLALQSSKDGQDQGHEMAT